MRVLDSYVLVCSDWNNTAAPALTASKSCLWTAFMRRIKEIIEGHINLDSDP